MIGVSGPVQGRSFLLQGTTCSIGRQADCDVQLLDIAVSRCHCEIVRAVDARGELWSIRDLDSRYGTFVNGQPVRDRVLAHGDLVQVAGTSLLFLLDDATAAPAAPLVDSAIAAHSTLHKRPEDNPFLQAAPPAAAAGQLAAATAELAALLQLCTSAQAARDVEALARAALDSVFAWSPADRGCMLVAAAGAGSKPDPADLRVVAVRALGQGAAAEPRVSRTMLARAVTEQVAMLCSDVEVDAALAGAESVEAARGRALLCAPLAGRDRVLGALYVESGHGQVFVERHLDLIQAAAAIVALALDNLSYLEWLRDENRRLRGQGAMSPGMVGESAVIKRMHAMIQRVAATSSTVLIRGESGTGKELCAQAIHAASARRDGPFVAINCATLSDSLLESELFGHEKGAFTGAVARKIGKVEAADHGTLFLDEIGELPLALQARLLRMLQEREIDRVGGTRPIAVDVRIVAATNRDLEAAMRAGRFRDDLFHRLNVVTLAMPALRERREDIVLLAQHFARTCAERVGRRVVGIADDARDALVRYDWPGNVRQLSNAIERALVLGSDELIRREDLPDEVLAVGSPARDAGPQSFHDTIVAAKRALIRSAYEQAGGDHQLAAVRLSVHPNSLHRLIRNLGLRTELGKDQD
jgi:transcriptional regulator with GAF, ATPase, and Fis domain